MENGPNFMKKTQITSAIHQRDRTIGPAEGRDLDSGIQMPGAV